MVTLGGLALSYTTTRQRLGEFAPRTAQTVYGVLSSLAEQVGRDQPPTKLTGPRIERWLGGRHAGDATKRRDLSRVRMWCRWMLTHDYIRRDPTLNIRGPREPRRLPRNFRPEWVTALLAECDDYRDQCIVLLMVQEGLRCIEVQRVQIGDIDFTADLLRVVGKRGNERELPITGEAREAIDRYLRHYPAAAGPLIRSYLVPGRPLSAGYISTRVSKLAARAGVHVSPHDGWTAHGLRHTAATDVVDRGGDVRDVQTMLGHASLATSTIYIARSQAAKLRDVMEGRRYGDGAPPSV